MNIRPLQALVTSTTAALLALALPATLRGALQESTVDYTDGETELEGFHVFDDRFEGPRPAILIVHQWTGVSDYEKMRARLLAELGFNVFALDIYGKDVRPPAPQASAAESGKYKADRDLFRQRLQAGLEVLLEHELTDADRVAAIGYCFGGTGVLELARSGADIAGVVSFHGGLDTPTPEDAARITASVLVLHGADDPYVPADEVQAFEEEMRAAGVDWQLVSYGNAVHSFTQPMAGDDPSAGAAYEARADRRSWQAMRIFFAEIFEE